MMNALLNRLARPLIWILWALRLRRPKKRNLNPQSLAGNVINESSGNTIEYFSYESAEESPTNILVLTGAGRENTAENLGLWKDFLGPEYNICIPNLPGYGATSGKSRRFETTEDQIRHNQKVLLDRLAWDGGKTALLGISYGTFVAVSTLKVFTPKLVILISPGKKIRQTYSAEFGLLDYLRRALLCSLAKLRASEALSFDSEATLQSLNEMKDKPPIFSLHGSEDECMPVQNSKDLSEGYSPFHVTVVLGAKHSNTRFGPAQTIIRSILKEKDYTPPENVTAEVRVSQRSAD